MTNQYRQLIGEIDHTGPVFGFSSRGKTEE
jgi:hypothetical protein